MNVNDYVEAGKNFYKAYAETINKTIESVDNAMNEIDKQRAESKNITVNPGTLLYDCFGTIMNEAAKEAKEKTFREEVCAKLNARTDNILKERAYVPFPVPPIQFINVKGKWKPHIIFNGAATIVFWVDGTKTVVKCKESTEYNAEEGLRWCIIKKLLGDSPEFWNFIKGAVPEDKADKNKYSVWAKKVIAQAKHINKDVNV